MSSPRPVNPAGPGRHERAGRRRLAALLGACLTVAICRPWACRAADAHALPDDPTAIVIILDSEGGFRAPPGGDKDDVALCIKADGTASIRSRTPPERKTWRMKPEELQDLLRFLLDEQKFFALKPAVGQAQPGIADAGGWMIRIEADGKTHTVRGPMAARGPANDARKRFERCLRRLQGTMTVVDLGGTDRANRFLEAANAVFAKEWPREPPLTLADMGLGSVLASGAVIVPFSRGTKMLNANAGGLEGPIECVVVNR